MAYRPGVPIGHKFTTHSGWNGTVIKYNSCWDVIVQWEDGSVQSTCTSYIKTGGILPTMQPILLGILTGLVRRA